MPSPMTLMFQKIPVSLYCSFTFLRSNPYTQATERGGGEEQLQVIATVETAAFAGMEDLSSSLQVTELVWLNSTSYPCIWLMVAKGPIPGGRGS